MNQLTKHLNFLAYTAGLIMTLTACDSGGDQSPVAQVATEEEATVVKPETIPETSQKSLNVKQQVDFAVGDLATRLGMDPDEIGFSGMTPVMWRSGALGCPRPGMNYTDALVRGVLIMLRVENKAYRYHGIPGGQPFFCPDDRAEPPVPGRRAD